MKITITVRALKAAIKVLGNKSTQLGVAEWKYADNKDLERSVEIDIANLDLVAIGSLRDCLKVEKDPSANRVTRIFNMLSDPENKPISSLSVLSEAIKVYMAKHGNPWLFALKEGGRGVAYAVTDCTYRMREGRDRGDPYVLLEMAYNAEMAFKYHRVVIERSSMGNTVPEILRREGLVIGDEDLMEEYEAFIERFKDFGASSGEQFHVRRQGHQMGNRDNWWSERSVDLSPSGKLTKAVLDMDAVQSDRTNNAAFSEMAKKLVPIPTHPVLPLFSLLRHENVWVNVGNMKRYVYEEGLQDKLILPASHRKLIGALVSNLDVLKVEAEAEDKSRTIRAKAASSLILARGPAGTGKTMTAEVYAEEIQRPLYEIQSGQIGVEPEEIEENLNEVLARSIRLRMPLLINEADVFIQERGKDLKQNAVVSVFLRLLEYHNGLIFLTTNRAGDIDDAFLSRCIAVITYGVPSQDDRLAIWKVMLKEFNVNLPKEDVRMLGTVFPRATGRDIQNLLRLTSRVCMATGEPFSMKALRENAVFKSIDVEHFGDLVES
jgi:hypothetical protein